MELESDGVGLQIVASLSFTNFIVYLLANLKCYFEFVQYCR